MSSQKQQIILNHFKENDQITTLQAVQLIGGNIHNNKRKWVGEVLSRMVKNKMLERIKPGVFQLYDSRNDENQPSLI